MRLLAAERLIPNARVLAEYERLRDPSGNPLFKSLRIRNLITGQRWHDSAQSLFTTYPWNISSTDRNRRNFASSAQM
ncbi:MAG: hypothetical protein U1F68_17720 [Gammaproteobacteria bacterium]